MKGMKNVDNIISSKEAAQRIATNLSSSLEMLMKHHSLDFATNTKNGGNIRAQETVQVGKQLVDSFLSAFQKDIEKIRSVATEFEIMDQKIEQTGSSGSLADWEGMNHGK